MAGGGGEEIGVAIAGLTVKRERKIAVTVTPATKVDLRKDSEAGFTNFFNWGLGVP